MAIKYKTEGHLEIPGGLNTNKGVLTWVKGEAAATLHSDGDHIKLSKAQLIILRDHVDDICNDLAS